MPINRIKQIRLLPLRDELSPNKSRQLPLQLFVRQRTTIYRRLTSRKISHKMLFVVHPPCITKIVDLNSIFSPGIGLIRG